MSHDHSKHDRVHVMEPREPEPTRSRLAPARFAVPRADEGPTLAGYVWTVVERRWTVAAIFGAVMAMAAAYLLLATPTYRANAVFQVEDRTKTVAGLEELSSAFTEKTPADTEIEIIRSRMLLSAVVDQLGLDVRAHPRRFPGIGKLFARAYRGKGPAEPVLGLSRYAWGGERIRLTRLEVSDDLLGVPLRLSVLDGKRYRVDHPEGTPLLEGEVGKAASASADGSRVQLFVSELVARPGTSFRVVKLRREDVVEALQDQLRIGEKVKKTGILTVSLDGPDPVVTTQIIEAVSNLYVRQNVERKSAEAAKTLEFLETQLPTLRKNAEGAQAALNDLRTRKGSVDITMETQSVVNRSVEVEKTLSELELQRSELRQRFTENHPALTSLRDKELKLRAERAAVAQRLREIPVAEMDSARLMRDVKASTELYSLLLNKAQELRIQRSGTIGNVRILDAAVAPHKPVSPKPAAVLVLSALLGVVAGVTGAFARKAFDQGAEDPEEIEAGTGLVVYATVPHSDKQGVVVRAPGGKHPARPSILAAADPGDVAVESLRSLRTSLKFAFVESDNNVVAIGGPGPQVGKSFVAVNLAYVLAAAENRVLLVDCDLRRGRLHRYFGFERHPGVSDVIGGSVDVAAAVRGTGNSHLDLLPTGHIPPNPSELLSSQHFARLLAWASEHYGYVVVDTPPVLAVADPGIVAHLAGVNLLVLRAGQHSIREIALAVKRFAQNGVRVQGAVLNDVSSARGRYGKDGRYRKYEYRSEPPG